MTTDVERQSSAASQSALSPPSVPGFDHIKRYYDPRQSMVVAKILPGEYYVTEAEEVVTTVLGSCVSACVWDPEAKVGGMNHFMLAHGQPGLGLAGGAEARYGLFAMEILINTILTNGGQRSRLLAKLAGGGHVMRSSTTVGRDNVAFARSYLEREGFPVISEHVEGSSGLRLIFEPRTGRAHVLELSPVDRDSVANQELQYASTLKSGALPRGNVELF